MVDITDIKDRDSLRDWLLDQPREVSVWVAHQSEMRVLPLWWDTVQTIASSQKGDLTALPILRAKLMSGVLQAKPSRDALDVAAIGSTNTKFTSTDAAIAAVFSLDGITASMFSVEAVSKVIDTIASEVDRAYNAEAYWRIVRADCNAITSGADLDQLPLWSEHDNPLAQTWHDIKQQLSTDASTDWSFWIKWYDDALAGIPPNWKMLERIALIDPKDWDKGAEVVNLLIADIVVEDTGDGSPLSQTSIADFSFDAARRWMDMIGFEGDVAHLRDPDKIQAFLDDAGELLDDFQDFIDFTQEVSTGRNTVAVLTSASDKVLRELQRIKDTQHIRARRLITLGGHLYGFSLEEDKRAELGDTLTRMLDSNVNLLREACRKHFSPSLVRMGPLEELDLGNADPKDVLADLKAALAHVQQADGQALVPLSSEAIAVLSDMVSELEELQSAIGEARTDGHREMLHKRFAKGVGGFGATIGRYIEKAKPHSAKAGEWADTAIKNFKRWKTMNDILEWIGGLWEGGPPV